MEGREAESSLLNGRAAWHAHIHRAGQLASKEQAIPRHILGGAWNKKAFLGDDHRLVAPSLLLPIAVRSAILPPPSPLRIMASSTGATKCGSSTNGRAQSADQCQ